MVEPSLGADRMALASSATPTTRKWWARIKNGKDDIRVVLHLHPALAPFKAAVLPLSKKLGPKAQEIHDMLSKEFLVDYDEAGSIGKRYRRQDEIGTPLCVTVDFQTVGDPEKGEAADNCVTIRDRDTMEQVRLPIESLPPTSGRKYPSDHPAPKPASPAGFFFWTGTRAARSHPLRKYAVESPASLW